LVFTEFLAQRLFFINPHQYHRSRLSYYTRGGGQTCSVDYFCYSFCQKEFLVYQFLLNFISTFLTL
jgi:hypothetical protein